MKVCIQKLSTLKKAPTILSINESAKFAEMIEGDSESTIAVTQKLSNQT